MRNSTGNKETAEKMLTDAEQRGNGAISKHFMTNIVWRNVVGFILLHILGWVGICRSLFHAQIVTSIWAITMSSLAGISIAVFAHRYWSHRAFKMTKGTQVIFLLLQTLAGQNCMYVWVRDHRQHHKYSDTHADPHNSCRGLFFSHIGWLMMRKHPDVIAKGKSIYMRDLDEDPLIMFQKKYYNLLYLLLAVVVPICVPRFFWEETLVDAVLVCFFFRYMHTLHATWLINSWAHWKGMRPYDKTYKARESLLVAVVSFGEGWHNYHHCFPWDYRTSEYGLPFSGTTNLINCLAYFGCVYDRKVATPQMIKNRVQKSGDGSHPVWSKTDTIPETREDVSDITVQPLWGFGDKDMDPDIHQQLIAAEDGLSKSEVSEKVAVRLKKEKSSFAEDLQVFNQTTEIADHLIGLTNKDHELYKNSNARVKLNEH